MNSCSITSLKKGKGFALVTPASSSNNHIKTVNVLKAHRVNTIRKRDVVYKGEKKFTRLMDGFADTWNLLARLLTTLV